MYATISPIGIMKCIVVSSLIGRSHSLLATSRTGATATATATAAAANGMVAAMATYSQQIQHQPKKVRSSRIMTHRWASSSSSFQAPTPPKSKGEAVYDDIDIVKYESRPPDSSTLRRYADPAANFVVTGASRGIGLQFCKTLIKRNKGTVFACSRSVGSETQLMQYIDTLPQEDADRITIVPLDLEDQASIEEAGRTIKQACDRVDLLLNVAGILGDGQTTPGPERSIAKIDREWMEKSFALNLYGPVMLSKELTDIMKQSRRKSANASGNARAPAVIANLSARVGSISDNGLGGWYSYRMSKAALNQATRTMSNELKRSQIWCIALHPGTTNTDLSKPFQANVQKGRLFPVDFTVESLLDVIDSMSDKDSGGLYDWAGKAIPF